MFGKKSFTCFVSFFLSFFLDRHVFIWFCILSKHLSFFVLNILYPRQQLWIGRTIDFLLFLICLKQHVILVMFIKPPTCLNICAGLAQWLLRTTIHLQNSYVLYPFAGSNHGRSPVFSVPLVTHAVVM